MSYLSNIFGARVVGNHHGILLATGNPYNPFVVVRPLATLNTVLRKIVVLRVATKDYRMQRSSHISDS